MRLLNIAAAGLALLAGSAIAARAQTPDLVMLNGKIVTVDDRFTVAQALAIRGQRIVKVGTTAEIDGLKGPATRVIDLAGRTVIPGLIDNHAHWVRAAEHNELRFDGVTSRARALEMLTQRVARSKPGEWIVVLGGWSEEQFTDDPRGFPLDELDRIAPNNPVVVQAVYNHSYLNSVALVATKIDAGTPDPQGGKIEKDPGGKPNGRVSGGGGVAFVAARIPLEDKEAWLANTRKLVAYLNSIGVTAWLDAGGRGMGAKHYEPYKYLADRGELNVRLFFTTIRQPATPAQVDAVIGEIRDLKPFQGNDSFDLVGWGESVFAPVTTQLLRVAVNTKPEDLAQMRRVLVALAERGIYSNSHVEMEPAIEAFLDVYEQINRETPIKGLRWSFSHLDQVTEAQLERMKKTWHDRADPQPAADPGCTDAQGARRQGLGHAALPPHPGFRHPLGPGLGRDRGDDLQSVLYAGLRGDGQNGRRTAGEPADHHA